MLWFKRLCSTAVIPSRGSALAAGLDLSSIDRTIVPAGGRNTVRTGLAVQIPQGWYGRIAPRSGLAAKHGIDVLAGVVDADFRGELRVVLMNHGYGTFHIGPGDRIAQLIIEACAIVTPMECETLPDEETERGAGGFGSTGLREVV